MVSISVAQRTLLESESLHQWHSGSMNLRTSSRSPTPSRWPWWVVTSCSSVFLAGILFLGSSGSNRDNLGCWRWTKSGERSVWELKEITLDRFYFSRVIDKRGIQIENLHPSDEGVYECRADNKMGSVSTSVKVVVQERPVLTVTPENRVQVNIFFYLPQHRNLVLLYFLFVLSFTCPFTPLDYLRLPASKSASY